MEQKEKITLRSFAGANPAEQLLTHIFKEIMPKEGYAFRESQLALAQNILFGMMKGKTALCEAEVGTGKTHAYLIAALVYRLYLKDAYEKSNGKAEPKHEKPITIATASISLQKSIVEDYIPAISAMLTKYGILDSPITFAVRKGKEHYVCDARLQSYLKNLSERDKDNLAALEAIDRRSWQNIDLGNIPNLNSYAKSMIHVPQTCSGAFCKLHGHCRYCVLKSHFEKDKIDIQITNLNYYLADAIHRSTKLAPLLREPCAVIFDEAHLLVDVARTMYGKSVSNVSLHKITEYVLDLHIRDAELSKSLYNNCEKIDSLNRDLFSALSGKSITAAADEGAERFPVSLKNRTIRNMLTALESLLNKVASALQEESVISERSVRKAKYIVRLSRLAAQKIRWLLSSDDLICWLEYPRVSQKTNGQMSLCGMPQNVPELLYENVWNSGEPKVLTSGTLSIGGDFTHTKKVTGLDKLHESRILECTYESPFDYDNHTVLYFSRNVPFPNYKDGEYIERLADELEKLIRATHGHTLVLFTSYKVMDMTYGIVRERITDIPVLMTAKGSLLDLKRYRQSGNGVLFATGSCWEGIDIPGDILSSLIIVKMPFPIPDPILDYERTLYSTLSEFKQHVLIPQMQIKIKQGCGRLIRSETDQGVICILDSRCRPGARYHEDVMRAVHGGKKTSDIQTVKDFIHRVKAPEYFAEG